MHLVVNERLKAVVNKQPDELPRPKSSSAELKKTLQQDEKPVSRDFDAVSERGLTYREIQLQQLAKVVSVSTISYPSDSLIA